MDLYCALVNQCIVPSVISGSVIFEPPKKIHMSYYRCDNKFYLDNILDMFDDEHKIGVCLASGEELLVYIVTVTGESHIDAKLVAQTSAHLINAHNKGGQSAVRFARNAKHVRHSYVNTYVEKIVNSYMTNNNTKCVVSKIIIGGFGDMKDDIVEIPIFKQYFSKHLFKTIALNSFDKSTVYTIIKNELSCIDNETEHKINEKITNMLSTSSDLMGFGKDDCINCVNNKNVSTLYVDKSFKNDIKMLINDYPNINIISTNASCLSMFGGWVCIKKYTEDFNN